MSAASALAPSAAHLSATPDLPGWGEMISSLMPDLRCARCGSTHWDLAYPSDPKVVVGIVYHHARDLAPDGFTPCVPLICGQCGGVEMFAKDHLTRWWHSHWA